MKRTRSFEMRILDHAIGRGKQDIVFHWLTEVLMSCKSEIQYLQELTEAQKDDNARLKAQLNEMSLRNRELYDQVLQHEAATEGYPGYGTTFLKNAF